MAILYIDDFKYQISDKNIYDIAKYNWIFILNSVQNPTNVGSIIRIANWFNIKYILISNKNSVDIFNTKLIQTTMGSFFKTKIIKINIDNLMKDNLDIPVYGALVDSKYNIYKQKFFKRGFILLGNESKGIDIHIQKYITNPITIPKIGNCNSLNIGNATSIICSIIFKDELANRI
ncbi:MAG: hypothetical protein IR527_00255 [Bacteroides sp.]|nr:MAG: hypothetical protein IR527_00255 [Bacteroides sp.]